MLVLFSGWGEKLLERNKCTGHNLRQYGMVCTSRYFRIISSLTFIIQEDYWRTDDNEMKSSKLSKLWWDASNTYRMEGNFGATKIWWNWRLTKNLPNFHHPNFYTSIESYMNIEQIDWKIFLRYVFNNLQLGYHRSPLDSHDLWIVWISHFSFTK